MPTLLTLWQDFIEEHQVGKVGQTTAAGDSTSVIDATQFGGPFSDSEWSRGDPVRITSGARVGESSYVTRYQAASGDITLDPALTGAPGSGVSFLVLRRKYADSLDRLTEALNRGLARLARRKAAVPLTHVTDGDLLGAAVSTYWTGTTATPSYQTLAHPEGYFTRLLRVLTSGAGGYAVPGQIPCHAADTWDFLTWMRAAAAASTAELILWDEIGAAAITPTLRYGALTTDSRSLVEVRGEFTVPAGCTLWRPRLSGQENPATVEFGPFIAAPRGSRRYTSQAHFQFPLEAGSWRERRERSPTVQAPEFDDLVPRELACTIDQLGWGLGFQFHEDPPFPVYYEGSLGFHPLSSETDVTDCPEHLALLAMGVEFFESLASKHRNDEGNSPYDERLQRAVDRWDEAAHVRPEPGVSVRRAYPSGVSL